MKCWRNKNIFKINVGEIEILQKKLNDGEIEI